MDVHTPTITELRREALLRYEAANTAPDPTELLAKGETLEQAANILEGRRDWRT